MSQDDIDLRVENTILKIELCQVRTQLREMREEVQKAHALIDKLLTDIMELPDVSD